MRPNTNNSSSAGSAVMVTSGPGPDRAQRLAVRRAQRQPRGDLRQRHPAQHRDGPAQRRSGRGVQLARLPPGTARRTSSWWTNISSTLASGSSSFNGEYSGGPAANLANSRVPRPSIRRSAAAPSRYSRPAPATAIPGAASSRYSRSTRCAVRSRVGPSLAQRRCIRADGTQGLDEGGTFALCDGHGSHHRRPACRRAHLSSAVRAVKVYALVGVLVAAGALRARAPAQGGAWRSDLRAGPGGGAAPVRRRRVGRRTHPLGARGRRRPGAGHVGHRVRGLRGAGGAQLRAAGHHDAAVRRLGRRPDRRPSPGSPCHSMQTGVAPGRPRRPYRRWSRVRRCRTAPGPWW